MDVQQCFVDFKLRDLPKDPQADMINRTIRFQKLMGKYDSDLSDCGSSPRCDPKQVLHHLDMAVQECAEAYDLVEGGWKHHKRNPKPVDVGELLMEIVDIGAFVFNAYAFMGGSGEAELVAAAVNRARERIQMKEIDMSFSWALGNRYFAEDPEALSAYDYASGSHGCELAKKIAPRINCLRSNISSVATTVRDVYMTRQKVPAASGFVYIQLVPLVYACADLIPSENSHQLFYSAFVHKNEINFARQKGGY